MNRIHPLVLRDGDDSLNIEVCSQGALVGIELVGFVSLETMRTKPVFLRINGHRANSKFRGCTHHADGDFGPIGHE